MFYRKTPIDLANVPTLNDFGKLEQVLVFKTYSSKSKKLYAKRLLTVSRTKEAEKRKDKITICRERKKKILISPV